MKMFVTIFSSFEAISSFKWRNKIYIYEKYQAFQSLQWDLVEMVSTALQGQKAAATYSESKQILLFGFTLIHDTQYTLGVCSQVPLYISFVNLFQSSYLKYLNDFTQRQRGSKSHC